MKTYTVTVNGNSYEVTVEEGTSGVTPVAAAPKAVSMPVATKAPVATGAQGGIKVESPMPGKILSVKASVGQAVKKGEVILVLEAMKMENDITATADGVIASINVNAGDAVEAGTVLATLN